MDAVGAYHQTTHHHSQSARSSKSSHRDDNMPLLSIENNNAFKKVYLKPTPERSSKAKLRAQREQVIRSKRKPENYHPKRETKATHEDKNMKKDSPQTALQRNPTRDKLHASSESTKSENTRTSSRQVVVRLRLKNNAIIIEGLTPSPHKSSRKQKNGSGGQIKASVADDDDDDNPPFAIHKNLQGRQNKNNNKGSQIIKATVIKDQAFLRRIKRTFRKQQASCIAIQANVRRFLQQKRYKTIQSQIIQLQSNVRGFVEQKSYQTKKTSAIKLQSTIRFYRQKKQFQTLLQKTAAAIQLQAIIRRYNARVSYQQKRALIQRIQKYNQFLQQKMYEISIHKIITIQRFLRGTRKRQWYIQKRTSILKLQALARQYLQRKRYKDEILKIQQIQRLARGKIKRQRRRRLYSQTANAWDAPSKKQQPMRQVSLADSNFANSNQLLHAQRVRRYAQALLVQDHIRFAYYNQQRRAIAIWN